MVVVLWCNIFNGLIQVGQPYLVFVLVLEINISNPVPFVILLLFYLSHKDPFVFLRCLGLICILGSITNSEV